MNEIPEELYLELQKNNDEELIWIEKYYWYTILRDSFLGKYIFEENEVPEAEVYL